MKSIMNEKSFAFAVEVVQVAKELTTKRQYELANQLIRCGTSIGANLAEKEFAQSDADFSSKLSIALKEAAETRYWLKLLKETGDISDEVATRLISEADEIIKMIVSSIKTVSKKL